MTTEEEMEGPISVWGYKEQESNLILPEHDDDDDELNSTHHRSRHRDLILFFIKALLLNSAGPPVSSGKRIASFRTSQVRARRTTIKEVSLIITAIL